ncbi:hypothetical protein RRG08_049687 [Elysia crispata]|uniref:Uncharacterized protein n=1 Tax=Elysia crispata TaxID=231223 RepID=A0AAE0ZVZ9_9GAST|nr:hypothetical protein RRG08_049687 [Elysia crispata]
MAHTATIEFQRRGLPYAHILLIMDREHKPTTPAIIDDIWRPSEFRTTFTPSSCLGWNPRLNDSQKQCYTNPEAIVASQDGRHFSASRDLSGFVRQCAPSAPLSLFDALELVWEQMMSERKGDFSTHYDVLNVILTQFNECLRGRVKFKGVKENKDNVKENEEEDLWERMTLVSPSTMALSPTSPPESASFSPSGSAAFFQMDSVSPEQYLIRNLDGVAPRLNIQFADCSLGPQANAGVFHRNLLLFSQRW